MVTSAISSDAACAALTGAGVSSSGCAPAAAPDVVPTALLILDGWGIAPTGPGNAPACAATPHLDALLAACPHAQLSASGRSVGLPEGYMGNSEVGHLNIGAGRVVYQDMTRIDVALEDGSFATNAVFSELLAAIKRRNGRLHLVGLLSDGGVHSHIRHLEGLCSLADAAHVPTRVHCLMDGRDTSPTSGLDFVCQLEAHLATLADARIASLVGRFYAMDRDKHWERVEQAWNLLVHGQGAAGDPSANSQSGQNAPFTSAKAALEASYAANITDEFLKPVYLNVGDAPGMIDGDGLFLFNFRADRMRELTQAFVEPAFSAFARGPMPDFSGIASMTAYEASFTIPVAFPKDAVTGGLGETVSRLGLRQLRLAETEKYAHVTYFFNGGREEPFIGEDRILVPSPREVATYDLKPSMSAPEVTEKFVEAWHSGLYDFVVCNLANGDMVGHTGIMAAAIEACAVVDVCVGRMVEAVRARGGRMLIIADHGNCEAMLTPEGKPQTAHTTNPVPCILVDAASPARVLRNGKLADVAPTLLGLWGFALSPAMTGADLTSDMAGNMASNMAGAKLAGTNMPNTAMPSSDAGSEKSAKTSTDANSEASEVRRG